jgi:AraC family transcriptional regulator, positive regulator of tynA and feaB
MDSSGDLSIGPALDYEAWRVLIRSLCGRYSPEGAELQAFAGSVRPLNMYGCAAVDLSCNAHRIERTQRDALLDGREHFYAVVQLAGQSRMIQNDRATELGVGAVALVDSTRPVTYFCENRPGRWLSLQFPRQSLISHLGLEPEGGLCRRGETLAGRLFSRLVLDAITESNLSPASADPYMQLAIYDLVGALFAASDLPSVSSHTDKLFARVCGIIKGRFSDPDIGPGVVAAEAGISLRYLQKLFTVRGSTYSHFIQSLRLDHAARLLQRRALTKRDLALSEIAYACGFRDYTHFARRFRHRFGYAPGAYSGGHGPARNATVRASTGESAP